MPNIFLNKQNSILDRGEVGCLPIPSLVNDVVYVDFTHMDPFAGQDQVLTMVCGLSRFCQFAPCKTTIDGEGAFKLFWQSWIQRFGAPREIISDNDVRFTSTKGFWQGALRAFGVKVSFSQARRPQGNGLCERMHRRFKEVIRGLMAAQKSKDWLRCVPVVTHILNNQWIHGIEATPADLFLGRPGWKGLEVAEPDASPSLAEWTSKLIFSTGICQGEAEEGACQSPKETQQEAARSDV